MIPVKVPVKLYIALQSVPPILKPMSLRNPWIFQFYKSLNVFVGTAMLVTYSKFFMDPQRPCRYEPDQSFMDLMRKKHMLKNDWFALALCNMQQIVENCISLHWHHNDHDGVSNHQPDGCLLNRLFRRRSEKTSKLRVTGLCVGNSPGPVNSPHNGPVTRKMFPFDDVIMWKQNLLLSLQLWRGLCYQSQSMPMFQHNQC